MILVWFLEFLLLDFSWFFGGFWCFLVFCVFWSFCRFCLLSVFFGDLGCFSMILSDLPRFSLIVIRYAYARIHCSYPPSPAQFEYICQVIISTMLLLLHFFFIYFSIFSKLLGNSATAAACCGVHQPGCPIVFMRESKDRIKKFKKKIKRKIKVVCVCERLGRGIEYEWYGERENE